MPCSKHVVIQPVAGLEPLIMEFEAWLLANYQGNSRLHASMQHEEVETRSDVERRGPGRSRRACGWQPTRRASPPENEEH